jgi:pectate disaccharide-lyase
MMRKFLPVICFICVTIFFTSNTYAQYTATWALTSDKNVAVTGAQASNVTASAMAPGSTFSSGAHSTDGFACSYTSTWPTTVTDGMNLDFPLSPDAASHLTITGLTMTAKVSGSSGSQVLSLAYQVDGTGSWTALGTAQEVSSGGTSNVNFGTLAGTFENGHTYVVRMYVYAKASGTSSSRKLYLKNVAFTGAIVNANVPVITLSAASLPDFGTLVAGTSSAAQSYTVSGKRLTADVVATASSPFQISKDNASFSSSVTLTQTDGTLAESTIYVKCISLTADGKITGTITHISAGAVEKDLSLAATAIAVEPTQQASISFGETTGKSIVVKATGGNGAKRIVVIRADNPVNYVPVDGVAESGVNSNYAAATDKGNGNKIVSDGTDTEITVSGLTSGTTYYFASYEYNVGNGNSQNYNTTASGTGSVATQTTPGLSVSSAVLSFGDVVYNTVSPEKTYSLSGKYLTPADGNISITAPNGFEISLTSGSGFDTVLSVAYTGAAINAVPVYVRFKPTAIKAYSGVITHSGGGAENLTVAVSGTAYEDIPYVAGTIYCAPTGSDTTGDGSRSKPYYSLSKAVALAVPGDTIYMRGGTYYYNATVHLSAKGTAAKRFFILAYPGEKPVLNWSNWKPANEDIRFYARGITVDTSAAYWYLKGLELCYSPDNAVKCEGEHTTFDQCIFDYNGDTGIQIGLNKDDISVNANPEHWAAYNVCINCDSYRNVDPATNYENADGFACKLYAGKGNFFYGCRSWNNCDDGWDCYQTEYEVQFENCWSWHNGDPSIWGFSSFNGDGNGFKLGGANTACKMSVRRCVALNCMYGATGGFAYNDNTDAITLLNCTAIHCGRSYNMQQSAVNIITNCADWGATRPAPKDISSSSICTNDTWTLGITVDTTMFTTVAESAAIEPRQTDGALPTRFARLVSGSALLDKGKDIGLLFTGTLPDLGAYELGQAVPTVPDSIFHIPNSTTTKVEIDENISPKAMTIVRNYPNPFNPSTKITFSVTEKGKTTLKIFDMLGREVAELFNDVADPKQAYTLNFNASQLPSGIYFSVVQTGNQRAVSKMVLLK